MKLPDSAETNQRENAILLLTPPPGTVDPLAGLADHLGAKAAERIGLAIQRDVADLVVQWQDIASVYLVGTPFVDDGVDAPVGDTEIRPGPPLHTLVERLPWLVTEGEGEGGSEPADPARDSLSMHLNALWERGARRFLLVNAYVPSMPAVIARDSFEWLYERDVVGGSSPSGAIYLYGLRDPDPEYLPPWSVFQPGGLFETVEAVRARGVSYQPADDWSAVIETADIAHLYYTLEARSLAGASRTRGFQGVRTWEAISTEATKAHGEQPGSENPIATILAPLTAPWRAGRPVTLALAPADDSARHDDDGGSEASPPSSPSDSNVPMPGAAPDASASASSTDASASAASVPSDDEAAGEAANDAGESDDAGQDGKVSSSEVRESPGEAGSAPV